MSTAWELAPQVLRVTALWEYLLGRTLRRMHLNIPLQSLYDQAMWFFMFCDSSKATLSKKEREKSKPSLSMNVLVTSLPLCMTLAL